MSKNVAMTLNITTLSIMALSITIKYAAFATMVLILLCKVSIMLTIIYAACNYG